MQDIIDAHANDVLMPRESHRELVLCTERMVNAYSWLATQADAKGLLVFSLVPKLHWVWHMANKAIYSNPRRVACWLDEDHMKHLKRLATSCTHGGARHLVPAAMLKKLRWAMLVQQYTRHR